MAPARKPAPVRKKRPPMSSNPRTPGSPHFSERDRWLGWLFVAGQFVLLGVLLTAVWDGVSAVGLRVAGGLAVVAGLAIMVAASQRLGRELRTHPAPSSGAALRVDGPYRFVRHPIYAGLLLMAAGLTAAAGSVVAVVAFAALLVWLTLKARFEERLLAARFPGYIEYARSTPRFVPRLPRR